MIYEGVATLLIRAGEVLATDQSSALGGERAERQGRLITTLVKRFGAILPELFGALEDELVVLVRVRDQLQGSLRGIGVATPAPQASTAATQTAPLERYRQLMMEIDGLVCLLHECSTSDPDVAAARRDLRRGLAERAAIEGHLVDLMLATT